MDPFLSISKFITLSLLWTITLSVCRLGTIFGTQNTMPVGCFSVHDWTMFQPNNSQKSGLYKDFLKCSSEIVADEIKNLPGFVHFDIFHNSQT